MNLKNTIFILIIALFMLQMIVMKQDAKIQEDNSKPTVMVSTFALYDISKYLVEDMANVEMILPLGADAHSYEPTPTMMAKLYDSDLVIYSGAGLEPWCKNFNFTHSVVDMSSFVNLKDLGSGHEHSHHHHESNVDPHYWLDVDNMVRSTVIIYDELVKLLPQNKQALQTRKDSYISMLKKLDNAYKKQLSSCRLDTIIVNHNAYSYLSSKYNFHIESLSGLSPDTQTSAKSMIKMMEHIKEHKVKTIFYENFASDKAMKNIAQELNVKVDSLQPLGNLTKAEVEKQLTYEDIMKQNLEKISSALECK